MNYILVSTEVLVSVAVDNGTLGSHVTTPKSRNAEVTMEPFHAYLLMDSWGFEGLWVGRKQWVKTSRQGCVLRVGWGRGRVVEESLMGVVLISRGIHGACVRSDCGGFKLCKRIRNP